MELYNNPPARYDDINRPKTTTKYLSPDQAIPDSTYTQVNGLTYTATRDGQIEVYLSLNYTTLTATSTASKSVFGRVGLNGNWNDPKYYVLIDYALAATHTISGRKTIDVKKGDVVSVWGYATGGGNLATNWTYAEFREL
jgi:hypothetical protein